ncbi:MAG TPA: endolytic transglycosylase MltG [Thermoleophilaceae bacterium]|nr:endolytic transglycosylase MltG [Thermoleophilaceae bacterium]
MSSGPPPVPGGRSAEEREAARRQRQARRSGDDDGDGVPPPLVATQPAAPREPSRRTRPRVGRFVALAVVLVALAGVGWFVLNLFQPFQEAGEGEVRLVIPRGASLGDIAEQLEKEGVVDSSTFFALRARIAGRDGDLKPGPYTLQGGMGYTDVLDELEQGVPPNVVMVTIPEGRSRGEIAPTVGRLKGNYRRATRRSRLLRPRAYGARGATSLEGFLFPATYELKKGQPLRKLVNAQLKAFKQNFRRVDLRFAKRKNLTPYDVLTIASLVERETAVPKERAQIASVIYNRLKNDIRLDIDATTRFAVGNWRRPLKVSELQNPSLYNTRVHSGLPPGPIGNPGLKSIQAAARPAKTNFIFYVAAVCGNGKHKFAESDAEFQRYVAEYDRARAERGGKSPTNC